MAHGESFVRQQLRLASSTAVILSVVCIVLGFWAFVQFFGFVFGVSILGAAGSTGTGSGYVNHVYGDELSANKLLAIDVKGPIEGSASSEDSLGALFGADLSAYGYDIKRQLVEAASNDVYGGVILQIDSPGGTIFGSKAIADGVAYYSSKTGRPVYAYVQGMAASGAYWAAASADRIIADAGTAVGSIGVIYGPFTYLDKVVAIDGGLLSGGVVTQNGVEQTYITAGEGKDAGNPFRRLTQREQEIMQQSVNDNYDQFVAYVAKQRDISEQAVRSDIGAHVYGEKVAQQKGLIDATLTRESAYIALAKAAGVSGSDFEVVTEASVDAGLLSWFSARLHATQPKTTSRAAAQACSGGITVPVVYFGDPTQVCSK